MPPTALAEADKSVRHLLDAILVDIGAAHLPGRFPCDRLLESVASVRGSLGLLNPGTMRSFVRRREIPAR